MRKKNRWLIAAALAAGVMVSAAGCGRKEEPKPANTSQSAVEESRTEDESSEISGALSEESEGKKQGVETVSVMTGTVLDAAMNSIVIQNEEYPDGIIFSKEDSPASFTDGLTLGISVTLFYTGRIQGDDTTETEVVLVRGSRDGDDGLTAFLVSGTVSAVSGEELTVTADDKTEVTVKRGSELMELEGEPEKGASVTVLYSGSGSDTEQKHAELIR